MAWVEPDYSTYGIDDLLDVACRIDRDRYPERWDRLMAELDERRSRAQSSAKPLVPFDVEFASATSFLDRIRWQNARVRGLFLLWLVGSAALIWMAQAWPALIGPVLLAIAGGFIALMVIGQREMAACRCPSCEVWLAPFFRADEDGNLVEEIRSCPFCSADLDVRANGNSIIDPEL